MSLTTSGETDNVLKSVNINLINLDVDWKLVTFKMKSQIIFTTFTFFDQVLTSISQREQFLNLTFQLEIVIIVKSASDVRISYYF